MTCIVGHTDGKTVTMGGDSAGVSSWDLTLRSDPKVFVCGEFLMGFTSSFRMGQILRYSFSPPEIAGQDLFGYMACCFIDSVRSALNKGGFAEIENQRERGGTFLVGVRGRLFEIDSDYQVGEGILNFESIGCGMQAAKGAMFATEESPLSAERRILLALRAAESLNAGVRGPFTLLQVAKLEESAA